MIYYAFMLTLRFVTLIGYRILFVFHTSPTLSRDQGYLHASSNDAERVIKTLFIPNS